LPAGWRPQAIGSPCTAVMPTGWVFAEIAAGTRTEAPATVVADLFGPA